MKGLRVLFDNKNYKMQWGTIVDIILKKGSTRYLVKIRKHESDFFTIIKPRHIEILETKKSPF